MTLAQAPADFFRALEKHDLARTPFLLAVNVADQTVSLFDLRDGDYHFVRSLPCSTSRFGTGQIQGSNRTPLGLHRVKEKIGDGCAVGTVFKSREIIGHTSQPGMAGAKITTRILWLEGLEPGLNRGGQVDSHARFIYIHGTGDETTIGRPTSCGCIHLAAEDLVPLYDQVPGGTLVWISEK